MATLRRNDRQAWDRQAWDRQAWDRQAWRQRFTAGLLAAEVAD